MRPILLTLTTVFWWHHIARSFNLVFYWYWKNKLYVYQFLEDLYIFLMFNASCCHSPKVEKEIEIKFFTFVSNFKLSCVVIGFSFWLNSKTQSKAWLSAVIWHKFLQSWQKICLLIAPKRCRVAISFLFNKSFLCAAVVRGYRNDIQR